MKKLLLFLQVGIFLFCFSCSPALAASNTGFATNLDVTTHNREPVTINGLAITPLLTTLVLAKGNTYNEDITLYNYYNTPVVVTFQISAFVSNDQYGTPRFEKFYDGIYQDSNLRVVAPKQKVIPPHQYTPIPFTITTTNQTEPGEYYIGVFAHLSKANNNGNINVDSSVGSLFVIEVGGNVHESGYIKSFAPQQEITTTPPVEFLIDFMNTGNIHLIPQGRIEIYDMFGKKVDTLSVNDQRYLVLPVGVKDRILTASVGSGKFLLGYYTAKLYLTYGSVSVTTQLAETSFWVIPWIVIYIGCILLGILVLWLLLRKVIKSFVRY